MEVVLISPYSDLAALGVRMLSAVLQRGGHRTRLIFLPYQFPEIEYRRDFLCRYSPEVLDQVVELCRGAGLIGVSLMTNYFEQAATLTTVLKERLGTPVIWGGIHPTIRPEECLEYADLVCIGEGEGAILDVVERLQAGRSLEDVPNIHPNPPRPMIQDLDSLPHYDYQMEDHHVLDKETDRIEPLTPELLRRYLTREAPTKGRASLFYQTVASRGCPHHCTYCCWNAVRKVYETKPTIRRRSIEHIMDELGSVLERMPWFEEITFSDDSFLDAPSDEIQELARRYKQVANRPFQCLTEPRTVTRARIEPMVDAGMANIQIGIQTGSERMRKLYQRGHTNRRVIEMAVLLREFVPRLRPPIYDFILDNPWETLADQYETLQLLLKMPPPFYLQVFRLTFFPGTGLFEKAKAEGLIQDDIREIYRQQYNEREVNYVNLLFSLFSRPVPRSLLRLLCSRTAMKTFQRPLVNRPLQAAHRLYRQQAVRRAVRPSA